MNEIDETEFEHFTCMKCGHEWWSVPGATTIPAHDQQNPNPYPICIGHCEYTQAGKRIEWDCMEYGCYMCGSVYARWDDYEAFATRREAWGSLQAESDRVESRYQEGLDHINKMQTKKRKYGH